MGGAGCVCPADSARRCPAGRDRPVHGWGERPVVPAPRDLPCGVALINYTGDRSRAVAVTCPRSVAALVAAPLPARANRPPGRRFPTVPRWPERAPSTLTSDARHSSVTVNSKQ